MKMLFCIVLLFTALTGFKARAGDRRITGKITDETNEGIPGAVVRVNGTQIGTYTNTYGEYVIHVPNGYSKLTFKYIGYKPQEAIIGKSDTLNVKLEPASISQEALDFIKQEGIRTITVTVLLLQLMMARLYPGLVCCPKRIIVVF